jgi:membrane protein implicated in regulation of membrane protease activity
MQNARVTPGVHHDDGDSAALFALVALVFFLLVLVALVFVALVASLVLALALALLIAALALLALTLLALLVLLVLVLFALVVGHVTFSSWGIAEDPQEKALANPVPAARTDELRNIRMRTKLDGSSPRASGIGKSRATLC